MIDIERAVERLTQEHMEHTEAGAVEWPPLLLWLEQSVTELVKRGGAGSNGAGIPIDFEALQLLDRIKLEARKLRQSLFMFGAAPNLLEAITELWKIASTDRAQNKLTDAEWEHITDTITGWVTAIEAEQNERPRKMELTVSCPRCETRWVQETDEHGILLPDGERKAAVTIEYAEGRAPVAECRMIDCQAIWVGWQQVAALGLTVDASMDMEVLKACGIELRFDTVNELH